MSNTFACRAFGLQEEGKLEEVRKRVQDEKELLTRLLHSEDDAELVQQTGESKKFT